MKKITIIETLPCEKDICKKDDCAKCYTEHSKTEQVPETWEELKELCEATNYIQDILKKNKEGRSIPVYLNSYGTEYIIIKNLYFGENGIVFYEVIGQRYIIVKDLTFAQIWSIIKSLIGE